MVIDKVVELDWKASEHDLSVSLSTCHLTSQESFSLPTIPGPRLGRPARMMLPSPRKMKTEKKRTP